MTLVKKKPINTKKEKLSREKIGKEPDTDVTQMLKFSQKGFKTTKTIKALVKKVNNRVTCIDEWEF